MLTLIRTTRTLVAALAVVTALAACSNTDATPDPTPETSSATPSTSSAPTSTPSATETAQEEATPAGPLLSVTIDGDDVQPNAQEIDLAPGEELAIEVQSDRAGALHVHSTPEQYIEFDAGATSAQLVIKAPGTVEVEDDDTSDVVALIEVR